MNYKFEEFIFTEIHKKQIIERGGNDLYFKILCDIEIYTEKWKLSDLIFTGYQYHYSANAIFFCKSALYGDCVLKIGGNNQDKEFISEYNLLREYNGSKRYIKVYDGDIDIAKRKKAMLIERVSPGTRLSEEPLLKKRLAVFSELFNDLYSESNDHIEPKNPEIYDTYTKWVCDTTDYYSKAGENYKELFEHMARAKELYFEIIKIYDKKVLLHGDFHFFNILSGDRGKYMIIDPHGIIGDPVFDIMRYISNESDVRPIVKYFEKSLNIPAETIRQCWYIEMAMINGWDIENDGTISLDGLKFAEDFMNKGE